MRALLTSSVSIFAVVVAALATPAGGAIAGSVSDFFAGKSGTVFIGFGPGGNYDLYGRLAARHIGRHIPGQPTFVAQNMPGAASVTLTNHLYNVAVKDGTVLGIVNQAIPLEQLLATERLSYDVKNFNWIGRFTTSVDLAFVWHTVPVQTIEDVFKRETIMGATGPASLTAFLPWVLNNLTGTKFRVITGFSSSSEVVLAIERGDVEGGALTLEGLNAYRQDWVRDGKLQILVQYVTERDPGLPDVPAMVELAKSDEDRAILNLYASGGDVGRSVVAPPEIPAERVEAMRNAFDAMIRDHEFLAEVEKLKLQLNPLPGEKLQELVLRVLSFPPDLVPKARMARERTD